MQARLRLTIAAIGLGLALSAVPTAAKSASADYFRLRQQNRSVPALLTKDEREFYTALFASIAREDWTKAQALFAERADGPLHAVARAEYVLAANSPNAQLAQRLFQRIQEVT